MYILYSCLILLFVEIIYCAEYPHILFIVADDLGWKDVGYNGAEYLTPTIDNLANSGIKLTNYYVQYLCSPTRSTFLSGRYCWKTGVQRVLQERTLSHLPSNIITLPQLLKKTNKYLTHIIGKWHLGYASFNYTPTQRGFDTHYGYYAGEGDYWTHRFKNYFDFWDQTQIAWNVHGTYSSDLYLNRTLNIIHDYYNNYNADDDNGNKSLFIYLAMQTIHTPIESPPINDTLCDNIKGNGRQIFCNKILYFDSMIKSITDTFKSLNLWKNTLFVFTTDNGGLVNYNNIFDSYDPGGSSSFSCNLPYRGGKATNFEGGIKGVAFINGGDEIIDNNLRGTTNSMLVHSIDWYSTFIQGIANYQINENELGYNVDSINMWDALKNISLWNRTDLYLFINNYGNDSAMIYNNRWKYIKGKQLIPNWYKCNNIYPNNSFSLVTDKTVDNETTNEFLFDLLNDPYEQKNVINDYENITQIIRNMIMYQVYNNNEYVNYQSQNVVDAAHPDKYCGVWYPWLDWNGSIHCPTEKKEENHGTDVIVITVLIVVFMSGCIGIVVFLYWKKRRRGQHSFDDTKGIN